MRLTRIASLLVVFALAACGPVSASDDASPSPQGTGSSSSSSASTPAKAGSALALARTLTVKGRAPKTGYSREQFGDGWNRVPGGCTVRDVILRRDLTGVTLRPETCAVLSGTLDDPYTGRTMPFTKSDASAVQIDHVVALSDAWQKGAAGWSEDRRRQMANDPLELLAVDGPTNEAKGDGDTATWLPPNTSYRCAYVARQVAVKAKYGLWVTSAEQDAMVRVLGACPALPVPADGDVAVPAPASPSSTPVVPAPRQAEPQVRAPAGGGSYYTSCAAARAAGAAPLRRGDAGYRTGLDGDGDGSACE